MNIEFETRILEIDVQEIIMKLESLNAVKKGEWFQRRYVYDTIPYVKGKWVRLRTNGEKTTLTYKSIEKFSIDGTHEIEVEVSDFDQTRLLLEKIGFKHRLYQENKRIRYLLDGVILDIDTWPLIPPYIEIEGQTEEDVIQMIQKLELDEKKITQWIGEDLYREIYHIDINQIKDLHFS